MTPIIISEVPSIHKGGQNAFDRAITAEDRKTMRSTPGITYQVENQETPDGLWTKSDVQALIRSAPQDFRIQSRTVTDSGLRKVWISFNPSYWEKVAQRKASKNGSHK